MEQYLSLVQEIFDRGVAKKDRTGTGTISLFGMQRKYDLRDGFPLVTTKKVRYEAIVRELLWFLAGATNIHDQGLTSHTPIWDAWADAAGELGPIYGYQWRRWERFTQDPATGQYRKSHVDQIAEVIESIRTNPDSRRLIVSAWNAADLPRMALPPCHVLFQFYVVNGRLDCQLYQRSADVALGVPYNIASYATLMHIIALATNLAPGIFTHVTGDTHIYLNHVDGLRRQLTRTPHPLPKLRLTQKPMDQLAVEDFVLEGYTHEPFIRFPVAV